MPGNSLASALRGGLRPIGIKASLQSWLGVPISLQDHGFWREWGGAGTFLGKRVTVDQALQLSTAWACVHLISETIATLPLGFFLRNADGSRTEATNHQLYELLHNQPNEDMTSVVFWQVVVASMLLRGVANVEKIMSGTTVVALDFLLPQRVTRRRLTGGAYEYRYLDPKTGKDRVIPEERLMRIIAFSLDGECGLSPVLYGSNVFGTARETDRASAETFEDSMRSPGLVTMDKVMSPQQREDVRAHVKKVAADGGVMVLEKGAGFQKLSFDPVSAELLASRSYNTEEICRWFGIDPVMVGHGNKDSNWGTGLEQKMIWFLTFALRKWCVRIERAVRKSLLTPIERTKYYAEFALEGILRADSATRAAFFSTMTQNAIMTRDECRRLENLPPMGGNATVLTAQSNMMPLDRLGESQQGATTRDALLAWLGIEPSAGVPAKE